MLHPVIKLAEMAANQHAAWLLLVSMAVKAFRAWNDLENARLRLRVTAAHLLVELQRYKEK